MKIRSFILSVICATLPCVSMAKEDMISVSGTACEIFNSSQSKSSVRVRVTDRASYNAVSQIPSLAELRSHLLEHDYNVIVYNLVDNYVQNMSVRTTSQDANELCVEVSGAIPAQDIVTVIANYSPSNPAPEYDFKKANGIVEEKVEDLKEVKPSEAPIMYNGPQDFAKVELPSQAEIAYAPEPEIADKSVSQPEPKPIYTPEPEAQPIYTPEPEADILTPVTPIAEIETPQKNVVKTPQSDYVVPEPAFSEPAVVEPAKALVYVAPVEFSNNTHSSKPLSGLKELFANDDVYTLLDSADGADYILTSKVIKAKIDSINSQTKRLQMVVSVELKINGTDGSVSEHQNRFVLFETGEDERKSAQDVAMKLLRKLLRQCGEKLFQRIEQNESKRTDRPFLRPAKSSGGL